jgi:hypothetical protein
LVRIHDGVDIHRRIRGSAEEAGNQACGQADNETRRQARSEASGGRRERVMATDEQISLMQAIRRARAAAGRA